jgi:hypothetical protein
LLIGDLLMIWDLSGAAVLVAADRRTTACDEDRRELVGFTPQSFRVGMRRQL